MKEAPKFDELMWPTIKALKALGGSATNQELVDKIIEIEKYPEEIQQIPHNDGRETKIEYNSAWARTYLKKIGAINNSSKGVWVLLDKGASLSENEVLKVPSKVRKNYSQKHTNKDAKEGVDEDNAPDQNDWKDLLLERLTKIEPSDFEKLCQLILRESGFIKVEVTGKTGDGGIDGIGILRINLLSFHVSFQCKRYKGSVGSSQIRDFRGAFVGRGDKGLFITTGTFTSEARKEANRDGAPAIDLIDGEDLCDLMKSLKLGVNTELVEKITLDEEWIDNI
jgi:restriction system protein